jgi:hypothetical protein
MAPVLYENNFMPGYSGYYPDSLWPAAYAPAGGAARRLRGIPKKTGDSHPKD